MAHESDFARCASLHEGDLQIGDASSKTESQGSSTSDPVSVHLTPETDLTLVILGNLLDVYSASLKSVDLEAAEHIFHQEFPDSEWTLDGRVETVNGFLNIGTPFAAECVLLLALEHRVRLVLMA